MLDLDIQELASLTTGGGDLENFERLFSKLKEMKGKQMNPLCLTCSHIDTPWFYIVGFYLVTADSIPFSGLSYLEKHSYWETVPSSVGKNLLG